MNTLTRSFGQFKAALGVVGTAISVAAALSIMHPAATTKARARD